MSKLVGGIATSHVPAIGGAIAKGLEQDPYWKPFFDAYVPTREWVAKVKPDVVVMFYNDHGLNFFLDKMPTFAVGAAAEYVSADEGWGLPVLPPFPGDADLSWHVIEQLVAEEFDITTCQEMKVDHGFVIPMGLLWPGDQRPVKAIPIAINTVQHPLPSPARAYKLGQAIGRAIRSYDQDLNVLVMGTGGLSHQLDGKRAGFINAKFDRFSMETLIGHPEALTGYSSLDLVELAGNQGVEFLMWMAMRGALGDRVTEIQRNYHVPISSTASALLVLECENQPDLRLTAA
jgi:protocatechuate 4,5-dioxygenase beta chain